MCLVYDLIWRDFKTFLSHVFTVFFDMRNNCSSLVSNRRQRWLVQLVCGSRIFSIANKLKPGLKIKWVVWIIQMSPCERLYLSVERIERVLFELASSFCFESVDTKSFLKEISPPKELCTVLLKKNCSSCMVLSKTELSFVHRITDSLFGWCPNFRNWCSCLLNESVVLMLTSVLDLFR